MLHGRLAEGRRSRAYCHSIRDDDGGYTGHAIAWLDKPSGSSDTGIALPHAGRARSRDRLGVWWEEDHVIAVAKGHELQTPEPDHRSQWKWMFRVSHLEKWQESDVDTQRSPTWRANCRCSDPGGP
jgi:hypothetical protein